MYRCEKYIHSRKIHFNTDLLLNACVFIYLIVYLFRIHLIIYQVRKV
jgi:hypothetical protein